MNNQIICIKCCMDLSAKEIIFDDNGICNFCHQAQKALKEIEAEKPNFNKWIKKIKQDGQGKDYDCLIGLSGGVDSSTVLLYAVKIGLRPLCFSVDNGWNDPKADENIMRLVEGLKVPFYRYVINLKKFSELQSAFMRGGIKNLEAITDHILMATTYEMANKYNIKWIISGGNTATESIMPASWGEDARDLRFIKAVYKKITDGKLRGLPVISLIKEQYYRLWKQIKIFRILDFLDYNMELATSELQKEYSWQSYGEKHCENIFTWWYQNYYLFEKWGIDKRKAHLSSLVVSGQMKRKRAMDLLAECPVYPKLGIEESVKYPKKSYSDYKNSESIRKIIVKIYKFIPTKWK
ncbi:MAG: N-acetyl sugar amidotransferase [Candidatus Shapirobacteria bacterium GW2011_GWE1_38_10]|uniref:N-acetyl sugar amidotransferase n=2 Tax=Patescibacteria group TaxID=1783273 RepID=A0A0G0HZQ0_9BACT|nr:MAG: N-acetyl sugar amidotransferase [Candidatus Shapirobacteria bacterium GW2011_GWE1_38_10]